MAAETTASGPTTEDPVGPGRHDPAPGSATGAAARRLLRTSLAAQPRAEYLWILFWALVESLPVLASGALVAAALDRGFLDGRPLLGLTLLCVYGLLIVVGGLAATRSVPRLASLVEGFRVDLTRAVVSTALRRAVRDGTPLDATTVDRVTNQTDHVRTTLAVLVLTMRTLAFSVVFVVVGLFLVAPLVAAATLTSLAVVAVALRLLSPELARRFETNIRSAERVTRTAGSTFVGLRDVVAHGAADRATSDLSRRVDDQNAADVAVARLTALRVAVIGIGGRVPLLALLVLAPWLVSSGRMSAGELVGAAFYLVNGLEPQLRAVVHQIVGLGLQLSVLLRRLAGFAGDASDLPRTGRLPAAADEVRLEDVRFAYGPHSEPTLDGVSLRVPPGDHLVIVGPSGAGKSTLANLVCGIVRPDRGRVLVGGTDTREVEAGGLRRSVTLVPQESYVFVGTVRENLCYLSGDVPDAALDDAVERMGADELVRRLGGYEARLDSPARLSEGERQRVTLVRTYLSPSPVLILDEATCHLHPSAEAAIEREFVRTGRTVLVIAHRMSSAMRARRVCVLSGGRLQVGTHAELVGSSPLYADLVAHWGDR